MFWKQKLIQNVFCFYGLVISRHIHFFRGWWLDANCVWFQSVLFVYKLLELYRELEEKENEMENSEYEGKKEDDLQRRLSEAYSHSFHHELVS